MNIPSKVKIGGIPYKVIECSNPSEEDSNIDGRIIYHKQELRLKNDMAPEYKENIFIHEIIHGILELIGVEQDENLVIRLSNSVHQVIKDNPEIFIEKG
ncbi:hypothetical protein ACTFJW_17540 [Clostridium cagae]|uniref:hypothetical protein n=1 Tax=Clostridium cagae TaxID=2080751 RepID=UPI003F7666BA